MGGKAAAMAALLHPHAVKGLVVMDIAPVSYSMWVNCVSVFVVLGCCLDRVGYTAL